MFEIKVTKTFRASHALRNYKGSTEDPHEHLWRCEATVSSETLDEAGCAADFVEVGKLLSEAISPITRKEIHETPLFTNVSPSAENVARYLYDSLAKNLNDERKRVSRITVWEDENHCASYFV